MSFFGKIDFNELSDADRSIYHYMSSNSDKIPYMRGLVKMNLIEES